MNVSVFGARKFCRAVGLLFVLFALCPFALRAQEPAVGSSCATPQVISDASSQMTISGGGEHWFKISLDLLPMGVFYPTELTDQVLTAEVDFHCPGIPYTDPTLEAAVKMIEKDNGVSLPFTIKFTESTREIGGVQKHGYELLISNKYKTLLMAYGILYETYAYVKITIPEAVAPDPEEEPQPIDIIPEEDLVDCMEGAEYVRVGDKLNVPANDGSAVHILPLNTWRADTVLLSWDNGGNENTLRVWVGATCDFELDNADPQLLKRYYIGDGETLTLTPAEMAALATAAGSEDVFLKLYSPNVGGLLTTKRPDHSVVIDRDGSSKATAFEFDWINGNDQPAGTFWYHLLLDTLYYYEGPDMAYHIVNLSDQPFTAHLKAQAAGEEETKDIALGPNQDWYRHENAGTLVRMNIHDIYYIISSEQPVHTYAQVSESGVSDAGCLEAKTFNWENGNDQTANKSVWYAIDMREVMRSEIRKDVKVNIVNMSDVVNPSSIDISLNCPSTGVTTYETNLAARDTLTKTLGSGMLKSIADSVVYVKLTAEQAVHVFAEAVDVESGPVWDGCGDAYRLLVDGHYTYPYTHITMVNGVRDTADLGDTLLYKLKVEDLKGYKMLPEVTVTNLGDRSVTINGEVSFECPAYSVQKQSVTLDAGASNVGQIDKSMVDGVSAEYIYIRIWAEQPFSFSARLKSTNEGTACLTAREFEWNKDLLQNPDEAGTPSTYWYSIDLYEAKRTRSDIRVRITNRSNETIPVTADLAFDCPYADLMTQTRTVAAGESMERVIDYSTFAMLGSAQIYAAVTAAQNVTLYGELVPRGHVEPDSACLHAVPYDWENGMRIQSDEPIDTLWVAVDMDSLRSTTLLPKIIVTNHCDKNIAFDGMFIVECPDSVGGRKQSFTLKGDSTYSRTMSRDIIRQLDPSIETGYIRIIATGLCLDYSFRVEMIQPDAGVSCAMPITFNWLSGHDQDADKTLWYEIDLTEAKAGKKDITLIMKNKTSQACSLEVAYAPQCPCEQPQTASLSLAANGQNTRTIPYSMYETMGSRIWIRLTSCTAVHFEARMDDPEPFDAIECPDDDHKVNLTFNTEYDYPAAGASIGDTVFYVITGAVLDTLRSNTKLSIRSHVAVGNCGAQTVTGMIYYHCPIDAQPMKQTVNMKAGQESYKLLERTMIDQMLTHDSIIVMLASGSCFTFEAELYDPNSGQDCQHALREDLGCTIQEAGETKWYRYDVSALSKMDTMLTIEVINLSETMSDIVSVTAYGSCGGEELLSRKTTIAPGDTVHKEIPADMLLGVSSDYAYLQISSSQQTRVCLSGREYDPFGPIYVTDEIEVVPNIVLADQKPDSVWYTVNIGALLADTCWKEVTIRVRNTDDHAAHLFGELAWSYEVTHAMTTRQMTINVGDTLQRTMTRADLQGMSDKTPFVRLTSDAKVEILLIADLCEVGDECLDPIVVDWQYGNLHQSDEARWYAVELPEDSINAHTNDALIVYFENLAAEQTVVYADLYNSCFERDPFEHIQDTLAVGSSRTRVLYNCAAQKLAGYSNRVVFCYRSKLTTRIYFAWVDAELTDSLYETQVLDFEEQPSYDWRGYQLTEPGMYFDTIPYTNPLYADCDSSRYAIHLVAKLIEKDTLCGEETASWHDMTLDSTGVYYDTVRFVQNTYWGLPLDSAYYEMHVTKYVLDTVMVDTVVFNFAADTAYIWRGDSLTKPGVYCDTVRYANTACDSAQYMLHIIEKIVEDTVLCGEDTLAWHGMTLDTTGIYYDTIRYAQPLYPNLLRDSAYYEMHIAKYKLDTVAVDTVVFNFAADTAYIWRGDSLTKPGVYCDTVRYANTSCDSAQYMLHIIEKIVEDTVLCGEDTLAWHGMTLDTTGIYYDTIRYAQPLYPNLLSDSAYFEMHITKYKPDTVAVDTVVFNFAADTAYIWRGDSLTKPGVYCDTVRYANATCDSARFMLHIIEKVIEKDTLCGEDTLAWHGMTLDTTGIYYDTIRYAQPLYPNLLPDSAYYEMHILKYKPEYESMLDTVVHETSLPFEWRGLSLNNDTICADTIFYEGTKHCPDSIFSLDLKVERVINIDSTATICAGDTIDMFGTPYFATGDYADTVHNVKGLDSIRYQLHLSVRELHLDSTLNVTISSDSLPYIWRNDTLKTAGTYVDNIYYPDSICIDSTFTLNLTVMNVLLNDSSDTICSGDTLKWRGMELVTSGIYGDTVKYAGTAFDSIRYVMNLTVLADSVAPVDKYVLCNGDSLLWHGEWYKTTGVYPYQSKYPEPFLCDSVLYTLDLTIREVKDSLSTDSICETDSYVWRGKVWPIVTNSIAPEEEFIFNDTVRYASDSTCDSVRYQMKLTLFRPTKTPTEHVTICAADLMTYTWEVNGKQIGGFKGDSVATDIVKKLAYPFCDSIVSTLSLVVNKPLETIRDTAATICYNEEFIWHGKRCDTTGIYFDTLRFVSGCDSVYRRLYLTVRNLPDTVWESSPLRVCDGSAIHWRNKWISESGVHVDTLKYPGTDCDSLYYMVNLIVLQPLYSDTVNARICPDSSYTWRGKQYTTAGWYGDTIYYNTPSKCDSIIYTLHLDVFYPTVMPVETATICNGETYPWYGEQYTNTGTYTHTVPSAVLGCDSLIYTLQLERQAPMTRVSETQYICGSGYVEWDLNHKQYTSEGLYYDTLQNVNGCDSIAGELRVIVYKATDMPMETWTIYDTETYEWHGLTLDGPGEYEASDKYAASPCDSVIYHLTLTVEPIEQVVTDVTETVCPGTVYDAEHTITTHTTWTTTERKGGSGEPLIEYVTNYDIDVYAVDIPENLLEGSVSVHCGSPVLIRKALANLDATLSNPSFAPNAVVDWAYLQNGGTWMPLDTTVAIDGSTTTVGVRCTVTTDCGTVTREAWFDVDSTSSYETVLYDYLPVLVLYGGGTYMVDKNAVLSRYLNLNLWSSEPADQDVWWYKQIGKLDDWNDPNGERNDEPKGWGWYFVPQQQDASLAPGSSATYYALIKHVEVLGTATPCTVTARTVTVGHNSMSKITPNVADANSNPAVVIYPAGSYMVEVHTSAGLPVWSGGPTASFTANFGRGTYIVTATDQNTGNTYRFTLMLY